MVLKSTIEMQGQLGNASGASGGASCTYRSKFRVYRRLVGKSNQSNQSTKKS